MIDSVKLFKNYTEDCDFPSILFGNLIFSQLLIFSLLAISSSEKTVQNTSLYITETSDNRVLQVEQCTHQKRNSMKKNCVFKYCTDSEKINLLKILKGWGCVFHEILRKEIFVISPSFAISQIFNFEVWF